jgi:hypothetical protein
MAIGSFGSTLIQTYAHARPQLFAISKFVVNAIGQRG